MLWKAPTGWLLTLSWSDTIRTTCENEIRGTANVGICVWQSVKNWLDVNKSDCLLSPSVGWGETLWYRRGLWALQWSGSCWIEICNWKKDLKNEIWLIVLLGNARKLKETMSTVFSHGLNFLQLDDWIEKWGLWRWKTVNDHFIQRKLNEWLIWHLDLRMKLK